MRMDRTGRLLVLCGALSALLPAVRAMAAVDAFLTVTGSKQGPIKGEAVGGQIHLSAVVHSTATATGATAGRRMHSTITITKEIDRASPSFAQALASNETMSQVVITFQGGSGAGAGKVAQKIVLSDATITAIRKSGNTEQITFEYQTIEVTYKGGGKTAIDDWTAPS